MIHVENLCKYFGPVLAVNNVSFQVEKNEIVGLLGNNGAGKTTIMRILTTYLPATQGVARVAGFDVMTQSMEVRQRVGYLPESIPLYTEMRVEEYLAYRAKLKGVDRRQRPQRIGYCLERCKIRDVERRLVGTLSKGYRQRVGLADAMINDPPILILDEPTDGLDPGQKAETLGMLRELGRDHTIMLSSHMLSEVETLVQRVIIIRRGHIGLAKKLSELETDDVIVVEVRGPTDQVAVALRNTEGVAQVTTRSTDDGVTLFEVRTHQRKDLREQLSQRIAKNGWPIRRLEMRRRKLQDRWNEINNWDELNARVAEPRPSESGTVPAP
ncbi:MAG TPA: ATP-binding cassette domain-containing protein [Gemmataceae bacterium]|jgi:ABC-2 type transport system ATP-binding protein